MPEFRPKDVCVVIPTRQRWDMLERTLQAFRRQTVQGFEIIVLADATEEPAGGLEGARLMLKPDTGVSLRLHEHGMRLLYEPTARVFHHHVYDLGGLRRRFAATAEGEWLMIKKHPDFPAFFAPRIEAAADSPPASSVWPLIVDRI